MIKQYLCPGCGNVVIKETEIAGYDFACWFCSENFYLFEVLETEREVSNNLIRRELRKHLGKFIKKCEVRTQIRVLRQAFFVYENFCQQEKLKTYTSSGLDAFIRSVGNWQNIFEQALKNK